MLLAKYASVTFNISDDDNNLNGKIKTKFKGRNIAFNRINSLK